MKLLVTKKKNELSLIIFIFNLEQAKIVVTIVKQKSNKNQLEIIK